ncbi:MAG: LPS export ABC transporter periplasmic protein LptC [Verrucomicrobiaceae bacterium]|nr:LPS export ABC transporter periplasmic protein LptC [Verrucomicrobiaceae bacterium]
MIRLFSIRCLLPLGLVAIGAAGLVRVEAQDDKEAEQRAAQDTASAVVQSALPAELTANFPIGREFLGVSIPSYTNDTLKSVMTADSVVRVDEQYLDLVNLVVLVYNSKGEPETTISMDEASYDLVIGELASKTPSRIEQPRFVMTGDKMTFQSGSQIARLIGNVKLVVSDLEDLGPAFGGPGVPSDTTDTP